MKAGDQDNVIRFLAELAISAAEIHEGPGIVRLAIEQVSLQLQRSR